MQPRWFGQLTWSPAKCISDVRLTVKDIPDYPGCYAFTRDPGPLLPHQVIYVGKTESLRDRVPCYFLDWTTSKQFTPNKETGRKRHKGMILVSGVRQERTDKGVYVRWFVYGGAPEDLSRLEASLISLLEPECNVADEELKFGAFDARETLDSRLIAPGTQFGRWR
jgi:hypothetical protein